jgi:O-antigen ligase
MKPKGLTLGSRLLWWVVAASAIAVPLFYAPAGADGFRLPKEMLLRATALLILAAFATIAILEGPRALLRRLPHGRVAILLGAIVGWSLLAAALSTNRLLSAEALLYTGTLMLFFLGAYAALPSPAPAEEGRTSGGEGPSVGTLLAVVLAGALPNAILAILQRTSIWNPFYLDPRLNAHLRTSALLGNANDVGSYLMPVALMVMAWAILARRAVWWVAAAVVMAGLIASQALTAITGFFAGCVALVVMLPRRGKVFRVAVAAVLVAALAAAVIVGRPRLASARAALQDRDYPELTSLRIFPFATAWAMFTDRPLTGLGPGTFKFHYFDYRKRFNEEHPWWLFRSTENYAEVHNDHLQVLAEEGGGGYVLFAGAVLLVATRSRRLRDAPEAATRGDFVRLAALPLAASFAVLALGAFPLEVGAAAQVLLLFSAAMLRWSAAE